MPWGDIFQSAGTLLGVGATLWFTAYKFKQGQKTAQVKQGVDDRQTSHDQLQEDLAAERAARQADRAAAVEDRKEDRARIAELERIVRHLEDEVVQVRQGVAANRIPPLPPREPWPSGGRM